MDGLKIKYLADRLMETIVESEANYIEVASALNMVRIYSDKKLIEISDQE